jgi:hypothetical protein
MNAGVNYGINQKTVTGRQRCTNTITDVMLTWVDLPSSLHKASIVFSQ